MRINAHKARHPVSLFTRTAAYLLNSLAVLLCLAVSAQTSAGNKVLYVTHEPGRWHDYSAQLAAFRAMSTGREWELELASGSVDELLAFLKTPDYGSSYDAIVYNFCLADSRDLEAMANLTEQTKTHGTGALLVHCAMHSWWDTFKKGETVAGDNIAKALADPELVKQWADKHPNRAFPIWGNFTGVASTSHGPQEPIILTASGEHPATARLPGGYKTKDTELYNNIYITDDVIPLLRGTQESTFLSWLTSSETESVVMWQAPRGNGIVMGLTIGHSTEEWQDPVFLQLIGDSVDYLLTQ